MNISTLRSRLLITTLAAGVGSAVLNWGNLTQWIPLFNASCVKGITQKNSTHRVFDQDSEKRVITIRELTTLPGHRQHRSYQVVQITDDPDRIFDQSPPSPLDYAVILESLHNLGYRHVILCTRMTWDEEPGIEARSLSTRLNRFDSSAISLSLTRGATPQTIPAPLKRALIFQDQCLGNDQLVPVVNQVALPSHAGEEGNTLAGFHRIESAQASSGRIQMLASWPNEGLVPSIELVSLMLTHSVTADEIIIHFGKHIRLGLDGPVIPIDEFGQAATFSDSSPVQHQPLAAEDIITHEAVTPRPHHQSVCLLVATGEKTSATSTLSPSRVTNLFALTHHSPIPVSPISYQRIALQFEILILMITAIIAGWLAGFTRGNRYLGLCLTACLLGPLLIGLMNMQQAWFGLAAPLAALLASALIPLSTQRQ